MSKRIEDGSERDYELQQNIMSEMRQGVEDELSADVIGAIEQIKIGKGQLADVILVILDLKPAMELDIFNWNDDPKEVKQKMEEAGLIVEEKKIPERKKTKVSAVFAVSRSSSAISRLLDAEANNDHAEYGRLMGYPETAIEAFLDQSKLLPDKEYPDMDGIIFAFKLSKDHHDTEFAVLKKWSEAIKKYAPNLYLELNSDNE